MKAITTVVLCLALAHGQLQSQQSDTTFWRGVYLYNWQPTIVDSLTGSLHLNTVMLNTNSEQDGGLHQNQLKIINQQLYLDTVSHAQQMIYEAEQGKDTLLLNNYFDSTHALAEIVAEPLPDTTVSLRLSVGAQAGLLVWSAVPDSEYHYNQVSWLATFRMKAEYTQQAIPTTYVVKIIVWCKGHTQAIKESILTVSRFPGSGVWRDFVLPFSLSSPHACYKPNHALTSGATHAVGSALCSHIDIRVYWYGLHTAYLDKVTVEDTLAHNLFAGVYDHKIKETAARYANLPYPHQAFYLADEPFMSVFRGFGYVRNRIRDTLGTTDPRARCVTAVGGNLRRFMDEGQPAKLLIDPYVFLSFLPHPSITDAEAVSAGIHSWNYDTYLWTLRDWTNFLLNQGGLRSSAELAKEKTKPLILIPQLHGIIYASTRKYRTPDSISHESNATLRPPSASELRLIYSMGMAYGAKGFMPFWYPTDSSYQGNPLEPVVFPGLVALGSLTNHSSNYDDIYGNHIWTGYKEKWNEIAALNSRLVQIGGTLLALDWQSARGWTDYPGPTDRTSGWNTIQIVESVTTNDTLGNQDGQPYVEVGHLKQGTTNYIIVVNRRCSTRQTAGQYDTRDITVTLNLPSLANCLVTDIENGRAWVTHGSGGSFIDRFQPGEGKIYRIEPATISSRSFPFGVTIPSGATLTINSGTTITIGNGQTIAVHGGLIANGSAQSAITFTCGSGGWGGITTGAYPPAISMSYCNISNASTALNVGSYTTLTVDNCIFSNCNIGINIIPTAHSPIPTMQITNNTFIETPNNGLGISIDNYSDILLAGNTLTGPQYYGRIKGTGIYLNTSSPRMIGNTIGWFKTGFSCSNGSEPILEDLEGVGNNTITNNTYAVICDMSNANLGYDYGGNSICYNSDVDVWIDGGSKIFARNDSWVLPSCDPQNPPGTFLIVNGSIDFEPCAGPCGGSSPIAGGMNGKVVEGGGPMMTPVPALVVQAQRARRRGNHTQADALLRAIVANGSVAREWKEWALGQLLAVGQNLRTGNLSNYFTTLVSSQPELARHARALLPSGFISEGLFTNAMTAFDANIRQYPNSNLERFALYGKFSHQLFNRRDTTQARALLNRLAANYPQSIEKEIAELQMSSFSRLAGSTSPTSSLTGGVPKGTNATSATSTLQSIPTEFALSQNYPNPFNPSTTINFDLPENSNVSLVVYDVLGRKVSDLASGHHEAGYHSTTWNASEAASGVYFARFTATDRHGYLKLNRVMKLLLAK